MDSLGIIFSGLLPLQFYSFWYVAAAQKLSWRSLRFRLTFIVGLLSGLLNIYWIFLFIQMYALALLCRLLSRRKGLFLSLIPFSAVCLTVSALFWKFCYIQSNFR